MDFSYQRTFLRSSLAKDPFALGDLGPEDVLRIESEFPDLFATSAPQKPSQTVPRSQIRSSVMQQAKSTTGKPDVKCAVPGQVSNQELQSRRCLNLKGSNSMTTPRQAPTKPFTITNNQTTPYKTSKVTISGPAMTSSKMPLVQKFASSPARVQYVSIDELRKVLKEFLQDKKKHFTPEIPTSVKKHTQQSTLQYENIRRLIQEEYSRKHNRRLGVGGCGEGDVCMDRSSLQNSSRTPIMRRAVISNRVNTPHSNHVFGTFPILKSPRMSFSASAPAPGFLKPAMTVSRRDPVPQKSGAPQAQKKLTTTLGKCIIVPQNADDKKAPTTCQQTEIGIGIVKDNNENEELKPKAKNATSPETHQIYVKGCKLKPQLSSSDSEETSCPTDTFLNYQQLKFARNLATTYEKIGLLQKRQISKTANDVDKASEVREKMVQTEFFTPNKENDGLHQSESNILETIAKELVYVEILKHLQSIQQQNVEENQSDRDDDNETSGQNHYSDMKPSGNDNALTEKLHFGRLSVIQEISEIDLITPNLSVSSTSEYMVQQTPKNARVLREQDLDIVPTPDTPDLSSSRLSRRAQLALKESPGNANDATDCSEISDFISSEKEIFKTPPRPHELESGSRSHLTTPQLSTSSTKSKFQIQTDNNATRRIHYKKHNPNPITTSHITSPNCSSKSIPSNFKSRTSRVKPISRHNSEDKVHELQRQQDKESDTLANLSQSSKLDDAELNSEPESPTVSVNIRDDENSDSKLSLTLGGLLSEGEFIGNTCKSPGEVTPQQFVQQSSKNSSTSKGSTFYLIANEPNFEFNQHLASGVGGISIGEFLCVSPEK